MSKKKNTLKDLDEFLKQQAATLVSPTRLSEKSDAPDPVAPPQPTKREEVPAPAEKSTLQSEVSAKTIANDLRLLALTNGTALTEEFCEVVLLAMEKQKEFSADEKMLINTALYLKHGSDWKDAIRNYWRSKNT